MFDLFFTDIEALYLSNVMKKLSYLVCMFVFVPRARNSKNIH